MALTLALAALAVILVFAVVRPHRWPEAVVAVPAAALLIGLDVISVREAADEMLRLAPVLGFLAAVLVLARLYADEGVFRAAGAVMARRARGSQSRLLTAVFAIAALTTAILSLDATVVLLTPVVVAMARLLRVPAAPHAYATAHLANSASLLLPVSNLTNLLAFTTAGISFLHFTALMSVPWLVAIAVEFVVLRWVFRAELAVAPTTESHAKVDVPVFALVVLAVTLVGFVVTSALGLSPAWAALGGVIVLGAKAFVDRRTSVRHLVQAVDVPFLVFVLCLGVVVNAVMVNGFDGIMRNVLPAGDGLPALLGIAAVAAVLSNLVNNLPAVLVLLPLVAASGPAAVLAVLIGVNIGPNLTYVGSLANLLWRSVVRADLTARPLEFSRIGLCTVPATLVLSVLGLWVTVRLFGA
ncbi:Na+/H+ antiporter NhaD-like permease [Mycolicibacterium phlei]|uniref:Arsenic transporter n=1 Tax=Mycolicibacterium phlei DSM 43239 = CCUG 21000 TaxID=1226750 RepID=A0A5N5VAJ4_MYCPH|nr:SLC13 family permease [Mycolicibacterium phlei]VEG07442.1 Na+/H+ antiporter NhaD-like permease [Mycobacteroides chelonae]AMO59310.1 Arsenical pump membrane protein [Mycolicibacterium phlei]KAB7758962.1 arsenic transporter [Mycolicibacterium phlei DSM 43239 = CCUG 21000]KXW59826.1 arsenic transporter [Mycolicibacterium phlei DSM 43072]KXW67444.1 arsenic transporter [Mycolicibacterium phlei DSM 43239 = CCUG 21000]